MSNYILGLLAESVPRSEIRGLVGDVLFDGLIRYNPEFDVDEIEEFSEVICRDRSKLRGLYRWLPDSEKSRISPREFVTTHYVNEDQQESEVLEKVMLSRSLHEFQLRVYRECTRQLIDGNKKMLLHLPTGAGKTRTASEIVSFWLNFCMSNYTLNNSSVFWLAQSSELCEQAYYTLRETANVRFASQVSITPLWGDYEFNESRYPTVYVCTIQKLQSLLLNDSRLNEIRDSIRLAVFDEAHFVGNAWYECLEWFSNIKIPIIGLTATPGGLEVERLAGFYMHNKIQLMNATGEELTDPIGYLRGEGYIAQLKTIDLITGVDIALIEDEEIFKISKTSLKELAIDEGRNRLLVDAIISELEVNSKVLVFACSVGHCYLIKSLLSREGRASEVVEGETRGREKIISNFKEGSLNCIINFNVLAAGFDAPNLNTLIVARPVSSVVQYSQIVGRALRGRRNGGNQENKLITLVDNSNHGSYNDMLNMFNQYYL